ncbi:MAG: PIN domain-containing protein [Nitrospirae bacterium]|nr:MAG: PIN domain-containing protein [Nitrospirota bacterium]
MKDDKIFLDTNIIVYAYDFSAGEKHRRSVEIIEKLWDSGNGIISSQVLQEFFVNATKKISKPIDISAAKEIVGDFLRWKTVITDGGIILDAIDIHSQHKYSFWDSLIIASAVEGGAKTILSEDLADRQIIKGVAIKNPFVS